MSKRFRAFVFIAGMAVAIAAAATASWSVSGQTPSAPLTAAAPPLVITAYNGGSPIPYTVPRTPWGDPDLQGVWSSDDTSGIPRERPKEMGNNLYLSDQAFAARVKQVPPLGLKPGFLLKRRGASITDEGGRHRGHDRFSCWILSETTI